MVVHCMKLIPLLIAVCFCTCVSGAELARGPNYTVIGNNAQQIMMEAERFRGEFVVLWGLRPDDRRTVISVHKCEEDGGHALCASEDDHKYHNIFLNNTNLDVLRHELVHCILASSVKPRLPSWVEEGIANRYYGNYKEYQERVDSLIMSRGRAEVLRVK